MTNIHRAIDTTSDKLSAIILIVDDSEIDRALYTRYLNSDVTTRYQILEAETVQKALEIWQAQHFDVILINFHLPDGNGLELLEAMGKKYLAKPPVIILTGQGDERTAVNVMKKGAADYLIKQDITDISLCESVHNLLNVTALNRKITRLQDQEALIAGVALHIRQSLQLQTVYQAIVEDVRTFLKADRTLIYKFNSDMSGEIVAEAVVPPWQSCLHSQFVDTCFQEKMVKAYSDSQIFAAENIYTANLKECYLQFLERFQVQANLVVPIFLPNGNFPSHQSNQPLWGLLVVHQCSAPRVWENADISLMQQLSVQLAIAIQQAELYENLQTLNASLEQKIEERTREVAASEQKFQAIFNNTFQLTGLVSTTGILVEANQAALDFGGVQLADVINRPFWETCWWTISPQTQDNLKQAIASAAQGEFIRYEVDVFSAGRNIATVDFCLSPLKDELGQVLMLIAEGRDITEKRQLERERQAAVKALETSEAELRGLFNAMVDVILVLDKQGRYLKIAPTKTDNLYRMPAELIGNTVHEVFPTHLADMFVDIIGQTLATQQTVEYEYNLQIGNRIVWFLAKVSPISPEAVIWAARDITVAKRNAIICQQVEQAFEDSQILLQLVMDSLPMGIFWKDRNSRYLGCNQRMLLDAGLSSIQEIIGKTDFEMPWGEDATVKDISDSLVIESGQSRLNIEEVCTKLDNTPKYLRTNKMPLKTPYGEIIGILCSYEDITEQKKIERELKASEQERDRLLQVLAAQNHTLEAQVTQRTAELRAIIDAIPDYIFVIEREQMRIRYCNDACSRTFYKIPRDQIEGKTIVELFPAAQAEHCVQQNQQVFASGELLRIQESSNLSGNNHIFDIIKVPLKQADGQVYGLLGTVRDITSLKELEFALEQSEQRFRNLVETSSDWVWEVNESGLYTYVSPQIFNILGYLPAEVLGKSPFEFMPPKEAARVFQEFSKFASVQAPFQCLENINLHKDGREITLETSAVPIIDENGQFRGYRGMDRDITVRKQAEQQLHNLSDRLNLAIKSGQIGIWDLNIVNDHLIWDDRMYELYGVNPANFTGNYQGWETRLHPDDVLPGRTSFQQAIAKKIDFDAEFRVIWDDGTIRFIKAYAIIQRDSEGKAQRMIGINFDITERKKSEAKLQAAEIQLRNLSDRLKLAVKSAKIGIWDFDLIKDSLVWDERMYKIFGVSPVNFDPSEGAWEKFEQFVYPDDRVTIREAVQQVITNKQELDIEFRIVLRNGSIRILKGNGLVQYNSQGQPQRMIGINYDITNRRREELENQRLKDRLEFVLSASPAIIYTCQLCENYQTTFISKNVQNILGYTTETWLAAPNFWVNHIHPEDLPQVFARLSNLQVQEHQPSQYRFRHQDGSYRWLEDEFRLVRDEMGQITEIIGYMVDISQQQAALRERELVEAEILRSRDLREAIFNESADALFLVDIETVKTLDCNQRAVEMFAATDKRDLIGIEGHDLQNQHFTPEELEAINNDIRTKGVWSRELEYKTFKGELFWGNLAAKQITVASQKINLVRVTDISQRKLAETQLQETNKQLAASNEELARATRLKDEFLANMSHELRTPLNAILGISEGLQDEVFGVINQPQRRSLQTIERSGTHLLELINDILDLSKIESGQMELDRTPIAISQLCQSSLSFIKQQAFQKRIQIDVNIQPNLPNLLVDERRIRQVLINLLSNAVKFTLEGGSIALAVTWEEQTPESNITYLQDFIRIAVIDTGIGIAPENLPKLFQPFIQIDSSLSRKYNGTGLGLSLVKRIVEMHGGKVGVSSQVGVGSNFSIDLPCFNIPVSASQSVNESQHDLVSTFTDTVKKSPLILLAEDNKGNILTFSSYLEAKGYRMILAKDGIEAVELTKSYRPDLILMDIQMPEMDGLEAIKQIRLNPDLATIPIIALTALAMPGDQEKCLAAGANEYLSKPLKLKALVNTIQQLLD